MEIQRNDEAKLIVISDLDIEDLTEFNQQKSSIPDDYTIQIVPILEDSQVAQLGFENRELSYQPRIVYETRAVDRGIVSLSRTVADQFLSPVQVQQAPEPAQTSEEVQPAQE